MVPVAITVSREKLDNVVLGLPIFPVEPHLYFGNEPVRPPTLRFGAVAFGGARQRKEEGNQNSPIDRLCR